MLDCRRDRLDYGELLRPPAGYRLDRAVATTYSANLGTVLSLPVALVYAQTLEGDLTGARFQLLEAIKQFSGRVRIYHQAGQLHVPPKLNWLYAHLEDALAPILPDTAFTSFHPKFWLIRFTPDEEAAATRGKNRFRLISMSRNMTFDRNWDVAASLEGEMSTAPIAKNQPVIAFLRWLDGQHPTPWIDGLAQELERVKFETPDPFDDHAFHPIGIPHFKSNPTGQQTAGRAVVLSPFLHAGTLERLRENTANELSVFGERAELEKIPVDLLGRFRSYHLNELIVDGESLEAAEEGAADTWSQSLHAKLFVFKNGGESRWFLGSANATEAAQFGNVEFMLELAGTSGRSQIRPLLKELLGEELGAGVFVPFEPESGGKPDPEKSARHEARRFEFALLKSEIEARAEPSANGETFDLHLTLDLRDVPVHKRVVATVRPFNTSSKHKPCRLEPGTRQECSFPNIGEVELSRFLHFRVEGKDDEALHEFLLRVEIDGLPADRLENILRKVIDTQDKFFEYLRFLLADEVTKEDLLGGEVNPSLPPADTEGGWLGNLPIYEQLLVVASRNPRRLRDVDEVVGHLAADPGNGEKQVIPEAFLSFWEAFRPLIPKPKTAEP